MSVLVLYAVVPADRLPPSAGATVGAFSTVVEGSVALAYEAREEAPPNDRAEMIAFAGVLQELGRAAPVLPVRFGTVLDDVAQLRELIRERGPAWRERLSYVEGHVELLVHAYDDQAPRPSPASSGSGREYLLSRAAARRHSETMYDELTALLDQHSRETRRLRGDGEVRVACLVPADGIEKLRLALDTWAEAQDGRRVTTTGPWPPFTFAEEDNP